jgi:hypothetical protein
MEYRLNYNHSYNPRTSQNRAAVHRVTNYFATHDVASYDALSAVLHGLENPHGCPVRWLARRPRKVILPNRDIRVIQ